MHEDNRGTPWTEPTDDTVLEDIYDTAAWNCQEIGLKRVVNEDGTVEDVEIFPGSRRKLVDCEVGSNLYGT